jgi:hypothetical protein
MGKLRKFAFMLGVMGTVSTMVGTGTSDMNSELVKSRLGGFDYQELSANGKAEVDYYTRNADNGAKMGIVGMGILVAGITLDAVAKKKEDDNHFGNDN